MRRCREQEAGGETTLFVMDNADLGVGVFAFAHRFINCSSLLSECGCVVLHKVVR